MANSNSKGDRRERELVDRLDESGFAVMRAPASGSATDRELPDVLAGDGDGFYAIEAKSSKRDEYIYLTHAEVAALVTYAVNFGAEAKIGVRYDYDDWYFLDWWALHCTPSGKSFRVSQSRAHAQGERLPAL